MFLHYLPIFLLSYKAFALGDSDSILSLGDGDEMARRRPEDAIPVIEVRGEGKPMSAAQIRELEEAANGGPLDIKVRKTWIPVDCERKARRMDFITFHYKGFLETGKKFDQTYGREPKDGVRIQLGVGMVMPGLDKGMKGMCAGELRQIEVPYRLSRKAKSKVWKHIPNDEHWLRFDVEMVRVEPWRAEGQFDWMDMNNDGRLTGKELAKFGDKMRREFGKRLPNQDIDTGLAVRYYVKYFDVNGDGKVELEEFRRVFRRDLAEMTTLREKSEIGRNTFGTGRKRDPGLAWVLDFNNDGIVTAEELNSADRMIRNGPKLLPKFDKDEL
uniref:peptidylprolyl isomerase n=1 Tax=Globodera pallida TaxID=36090 RepID=A0A183BNW3_GLOPA